MRSTAIFAISLFLLSLLLVLGNFGKVSALTASDNMQMTFYFHYSDAPVYVGGTMSHYVMNTTALFQATNNSVLKPEGQPKIEIDFYMYPNLAAPVTFNGTWQIIIWANASALKPAVWNIEFWEVDSGGFIVWDSTLLTPTVIGGPATNNGYLDVPIYAYNLSYPYLVHTFSPGNTILAAVVVNPGSTVSARIWYDSSSFPSLAIFPSVDHIAVASVETYRADNTQTSTFEPTYSERLVRIRSNVTDPFGGYDVYEANVTVLDPSGHTVVENEGMTRIAGNSESFSTMFEFNYTYGIDALTGQYNITVTATDNNGHNVSGYGFFIIGMWQSYLFYTEDSKGLCLPNAELIITQSATQTIGFTNSSGFWGPVLLPTGEFNVSVIWEGVVVNSSLNFIVPYTNVTTLVTLRCHVHDVIVTLVDSKGFTLPNTPVSVTFANGSKTILPLYTFSNGSLYFDRIPWGTYSFQAYWQGILVNSSSVYIDSNEQIILNCQVYYGSFRVIDDTGIPLKEAFIIVAQPNVTSSLLATDSSGSFNLNRIPVGNYEIKVLWQSVNVKTVSITVNSNFDMVLTTAVYHVKIDIVDSKGNALPNAMVIMTPPNPYILPQLIVEANSSGFLSLDQIPGGLYSFKVMWQGVEVNSTQINVASSGYLTITAQVYYFSVKVIDNGGGSVPNALLIVYKTPSGTPYTVVVTNESGIAVLNQVPIGDYLLKVEFSTTYMFTPIHVTASLPVTINSNGQTTVKLSDYPPPFYATFPFLMALPITTLLLLIIFLIFKMRKSKVSRTPPPIQKSEN
jgi:hypothetical protein